MKTESSFIKLLPTLALAGILAVCAAIRAHAGAQVAQFHANGNVAGVSWSTVDYTTHLLTYTNVEAHRTGNSTFLFISLAEIPDAVLLLAIENWDRIQQNYKLQ